MIMNNIYSIWAEKYRPKTIDSFVGDKLLKDTIRACIKKNDVNHLLLHSVSPGVGKTSLAKIIINSIDCDSLYINASDNNGVDYIRDKIKPFAQSMGNKDLKIIILDEFDFTTPNFQAALRNLMETTSATTRFILTCNYISKIIDPIISRCQVYKIESPSLQEIAKYTVNILNKENIKYNNKDVGKIIKNNYPDIRRIVNTLQQLSFGGELKLEKITSSYQNIKSKIINHLKTVDKYTFNNIRQIIADGDVKAYEELYKELYDKIDDYGNNKIGDIIEIIADHEYQSNFVVDKEITFMACIYSIIKIKELKNNIL